MKKSLLAVILGVTLLAGVAPVASAITVSDLQAQVQSLLNLVASLQSQLATRTTTYTPTYTHQQTYPYYNYSYPVVGNDRDAYGCISSAGYSWCSSLNQCIRPWETTCPTTNTTANPSDNPNCSAWFDGCNNCSRSYYDGPGMCTLMACVANQVPYCKSYFNNSNTGGQYAPVISSFTGPTQLNANQSGTWSINAYDPDNGSLTYSVTWGDEGTYGYAYSNTASSQTFTQNTTLSHTYHTPGTYTVRITVRDNTGQTTQASTTVRVQSSGGTCTQEYNPVCGQVPYSYIQNTYSNMCYLNAANASFLHYGKCYQY